MDGKSTGRRAIPASSAAELDISQGDRRALVEGCHKDPHRVLGRHRLTKQASGPHVIRAFHPHAVKAELIFEGDVRVPMRALHGDGLFAAATPAASPDTYDIRFEFEDGQSDRRADPYRFTPTLGEIDIHLLGEGQHLELWKRLGSRVIFHEGTCGTAFAVWAPNAAGVSLVGDFSLWQACIYPMRQLGSSGVFELFVPEDLTGALYKYAVRQSTGHTVYKSDPVASSFEPPPYNASRVFRSEHTWTDDAWIQARSSQDRSSGPLAIYEVHLGSWMRDEKGQWLNYRELAQKLVPHAKRYGFTHIELMPIAEHPFGASWGYQVSGFFAPTYRHGTPDDFRAFINTCHEQDLGVILDWVPGHFPKDEFALARFDGTALYEHADPRRGEHPDWGTLIFNYDRNEVRNFLLANALYWIQEFHIDGLRVDAVASMLYLDYSRNDGEWLPNRYGGKENLGAIDLLRQVNHEIVEHHPGCMVIAEESTAWPGVTRPADVGGLGFAYKWNMGWMNDSLKYFEREPVHRKYHQNDLTFAMLYEYSEHFINPLSHDEVVHGKNSLLNKMPGDPWQQFANLRCLLTYQYTRPGKPLIFMGTELAPEHEWYYDASLDWNLLEDPVRRVWSSYVAALGQLYLNESALWGWDSRGDGFHWISCDDHENSVYAYARIYENEQAIVVLNLTPQPRPEYKLGSPLRSNWRVVLNSDDEKFGGSGWCSSDLIKPIDQGLHGFSQGLSLNIPPLSAMVLKPVSS